MIKRDLTFCLWCFWVGLTVVGVGPMAKDTLAKGTLAESTGAKTAGGESARPAADIALVESTVYDNHPYYISLVNMYWNEETKTYQVSIRLFWDDLEQALEEKHGNKAYLATEWEIEQANKWIFEYLDEHVKVWTVTSGTTRDASHGLEQDANLDPSSLQSDQSVSWTWIGREDEMDVVWCYIESDIIEDPKQIALDVTIFHELFRTQTNLVNLTLSSNEKSMLYRKGRGKSKVLW